MSFKGKTGGWVKIYNLDIIRAVDESGVKSDAQKLPHCRWVPRWVVVSSKIWFDFCCANNVSTYGGLNLAEFLKAADPDGAK